MPLPPPSCKRKPLHTRTVVLDGFSREDGLWDIEARLLDQKADDFSVLDETRKAGEPIHNMQLRITIDDQFQILAADAHIDSAPFTGTCELTASDYPKQLVGLNLFDDFRRQVKARLGGTDGCSHLSELAMFLPSAAMQTFAGAYKSDPGQKPFLLDRCYALDSHSDVVRRHFPRWYRASESR